MVYCTKQATGTGRFVLLDANATSASQIRLQHAQEIATACPPTLYDEIALTGSSARGIATHSSDIEINFWVSDLPSLEAREQWISSLDTQQVIAQKQPRPDASYWVNAIYKGIELEAGWQTFDALESALTDLIEARTTDHKALRLAELVLSAKPLRGSGVLAKWQSTIKDYPEPLADMLIEDALTDWLSPNFLDNYHENRFKSDIHRIWRVLFALNQQWEINWKYASYSLPSLEIYPKNIIERLEVIQQSQAEAAHLMLILIGDIFELIKTNKGETKYLSENFNLFQQLLDHTHSLR